jgi:hypothetical protein
VSEHGDDHEEIAWRIDHLLATVFVAADDQRMAAPTWHAAPDLVGGSHRSQRDVRGIGARAAQRPIMRVRDMGRER